MGKIENLMREAARRDFEAGKIQGILGWKKDEFSKESVPAFIDSIEEINELVWDEFCVSNLAKYLMDETKDGRTVGVFLKGCDAKGFQQLLSDNRISKESVVAYGVSCAGMKDFRTDELYKKCAECVTNNPAGCDEILGDTVEVSETDRFADVREIEAMSHDERYDYWMGELSKCIRCNACRNICPACSCETCVFEAKDQDVLGKANNESETGFYQIIRAYHVAGRCSDCGECERVCPSGIPLSKINRKIIKDIEELYGEEETDTLTSYTLEDKDTFTGKKGGK